MPLDRNSIPTPGPVFGPRLMWTEVRPATESASGVFVLRSPTTTMCVRAGSNIAVYFRPPDHAMAAVRDRTGSPTISTSGLHSFAYSVPGADAPGWLDVASSRLSVAG